MSSDTHHPLVEDSSYGHCRCNSLHEFTSIVLSFSDLRAVLAAVSPFPLLLVAVLWIVCDLASSALLHLSPVTFPGLCPSLKNRHFVPTSDCDLRGELTALHTLQSTITARRVLLWDILLQCRRADLSEAPHTCRLPSRLFSSGQHTIPSIPPENKRF